MLCIGIFFASVTLETFFDGLQLLILNLQAVYFFNPKDPQVFKILREEILR